MGTTGQRSLRMLAASPRFTLLLLCAALCDVAAGCRCLCKICFCPQGNSQSDHTYWPSSDAPAVSRYNPPDLLPLHRQSVSAPLFSHPGVAPLQAGRGCSCRSSAFCTSCSCPSKTSSWLMWAGRKRHAAIPCRLKLPALLLARKYRLVTLQQYLQMSRDHMRMPERLPMERMRRHTLTCQCSKA